MELCSIGFCGVNCADCPDYACGICHGCRQTFWQDNDKCPPVACCEKRDIELCGQCGEFPCGMMSEFYDESDSHRAARKLMYSINEELKK